MKTVAIVLAAGKGSRMKQAVPKQFLEVGGYPLIFHSLKTFEESEVDGIILVTGEESLDYCKKEIVDKYHFQKVWDVVPGGSERYISVHHGLMAVEKADIALIHDGARPCVSRELIRRVIASVKQYGSGVTAVHAKDTISQADEGEFLMATLDRSTLWNIQTPQGFYFDEIFKAYERVVTEPSAEVMVPSGNGMMAKQLRDVITDDASALRYGSTTLRKIKLVEGSYQNIKVTTPEDILVAELFLGIEKFDD